MLKKLFAPLAILATVALLLSACNNEAAKPADVNNWPQNWGNSTLESTLARKCVGLPAGSSVPVNGAQVPCPATAAPAPIDLCADQVNPAWSNWTNGLTQEIYNAWLKNVVANGGAVYAPSKCSVAVNSREFGPGAVTGVGPTQLVTQYRTTNEWHPYVDATYTFAAGCTFEPWFDQGDAPIAVYRTPGVVRVQNDFSNGVSLVGIVTCP